MWKNNTKNIEENLNIFLGKNGRGGGVEILSDSEGEEEEEE